MSVNQHQESHRSEDDSRVTQTALCGVYGYVTVRLAASPGGVQARGQGLGVTRGSGAEQTETGTRSGPQGAWVVGNGMDPSDDQAQAAGSPLGRASTTAGVWFKVPRPLVPPGQTRQVPNTHLVDSKQVTRTAPRPRPSPPQGGRSRFGKPRRLGRVRFVLQLAPDGGRTGWL